MNGDNMSKLLGSSREIDNIINKLNKVMKEISNSESMRKLRFFNEAISNLQKLGRNYNWVVITPNVDINIVNKDKSEINNYFMSLIDDDSDLYKSIEKELSECQFMKAKKKLIEQIFDALERKDYWISCIALSTILEYLLAFENNIDSIKMRVLLEKFIDNVGDISISEYEVGFLYSLDGFLNNYIQTTNGFGKDKEPEYINRHWIAHGRMYRELTKIDTYQILFAVYACIRVMEMERRVKLEECQ